MPKKDTIENRVWLFESLARAVLERSGADLGSRDAERRAKVLRALADVAYVSCVVADTQALAPEAVRERVLQAPRRRSKARGAPRRVGARGGRGHGMAEPRDPYAPQPQVSGVAPPAQDAQGRYVAPLVTAPLLRRLAAKLVDMVISGLLSWSCTFLVAQPWASGIGLGWFVLADWLGSPGKWLFSLRVVREGGGPVTALASVQRNILLGLPSFGRALSVSGLTGLTGTWALVDRGVVGLFGVVVVVSEVFAMWVRDGGRRWGDRFGRTRVVTR